MFSVDFHRKKSAGLTLFSFVGWKPDRPARLWGNGIFRVSKSGGLRGCAPLSPGEGDPRRFRVFALEAGLKRIQKQELQDPCLWSLFSVELNRPGGGGPAVSARGHLGLWGYGSRVLIVGPQES